MRKAAEQDQRSGGVLRGFRRHAPPKKTDCQSQTAKTMGTAFSRGTGDHLPPMNTGNALFVTETQATELHPELIIEQMELDELSWASEDPEAGGIVKVGVPGQGMMVRVKVTGQAIIYLDAQGKLVVDNRGY